MPDRARRHQSPQAGHPTCRHEAELWRAGYRTVAGVDEVGRGALAGPVLAAAVSLVRNAPRPWLDGLRDSKALTPRRRRALARLLFRDTGVNWALGWASAADIDRLGIVEATRCAMRRAVADLRPAADYVLVDGRNAHHFPCPHTAVVGGDARIASVAAASVLAKVTRDAWMGALDLPHPSYGFARHKGYGTSAHVHALNSHGPCSQHRYSFAPVRVAAASVRDGAPVTDGASARDGPPNA